MACLKSEVPRGIRNNNPLNIRLSDQNAWKGKVQLNTDGVFEQFIEMKYGVRAWCRLIYNYVKKHHCSTVRAIVMRFAPPTENDSLFYANFVCEYVGNIPVDTLSRNFMFRLCSSMFYIENGIWPNSECYDSIREGIDMYLNEIKNEMVQIH